MEIRVSFELLSGRLIFLFDGVAYLKSMIQKFFNLIYILGWSMVPPVHLEEDP